jgi:uncharacterized protein YjiS (DUF1127 family)
MKPAKYNPEFDTFDFYKQAHALRAQAIGRAFGRLVRVVAGWLKRAIVAPVLSRAEQRRQFDELLAMDDHMLRDLGIARGNIVYAFEHGREPELPTPANTNRPTHKAA